MLAVVFLGATATAFTNREPAPANAEPWHEVDHLFVTPREARLLRDSLVAVQADLDLASIQYNRAFRILGYTTRYDISPRLATKVFDAAMIARVDPELGFRLVRLESEFNPRAVSPAGALGLTQLMPTTAARFERGLTRDRIMDEGTNLKIGFRYLRLLLDMYDGDVRLALLAYNRGEYAVSRDLLEGRDPGNGYDRIVARGYTGPGRLD
jgi:soluble lytic murein transglycosylase-like protein